MSLNIRILKNSQNLCLEQEFASKVQQLSSAKTFKDFRYPNEPFQEEELQKHLYYVRPGGVLVTTGSERPFFTANVAERLLRKFAEKFKHTKSFFRGILVLDINPQVKKYVDYNVLLLRISRSKEEYNVLSMSADIEDVRSYIETRLQEELSEGNLSEVMKNYYLTNLEELHKHYHCFDLDSPEFPFCHQQAWRSESIFQKLIYWKKDSDFYPLHKLAKGGNIIAVTGDIQDLSFLKRKNISLVDVSNIPAFIRPSAWQWKIENNRPLSILFTYLPPPYDKRTYIINSKEQTKTVCRPEQIHFISYPYNVPLDPTLYRRTVDGGKTNTVLPQVEYYHQPSCVIS